MKIEIETKFDIGDKVQVSKNSSYYEGYKDRLFNVYRIEASSTYEFGSNWSSVIKVWATSDGGYTVWFYESHLEPYVPKKHYVITCTQDGSIINSATNTTWYSSMQEAIKAVQEHQERTMLDKSVSYTIGYDPNRE